MRLLLIVVIALLAAGCCAPRLDWADIPEDQPVSIEFLDQQVPSGDWIYRVRVRFYERTEYEGLIQEIHFSDGNTLVEYFRMDDGRMEVCHKDVHTRIGMDYEVREMIVYPANVEGVDYRGTFAMLPENMDGSVRTTTGTNFNKDYRKNHAVKGRVVSAALDLAVHWSIEYNHGELTVTIPPQADPRRN